MMSLFLVCFQLFLLELSSREGNEGWWEVAEGWGAWYLGGAGVGLRAQPGYHRAGSGADVEGTVLTFLDGFPFSGKKGNKFIS